MGDDQQLSGGGVTNCLHLAGQLGHGRGGGRVRAASGRDAPVQQAGHQSAYQPVAHRLDDVRELRVGLPGRPRTDQRGRREHGEPARGLARPVFEEATVDGQGHRLAGHQGRQGRQRGPREQPENRRAAVGEGRAQHLGGGAGGPPRPGSGSRDSSVVGHRRREGDGGDRGGHRFGPR
ncbi:hypothetical protein OHB41_05135 [Streptomyces sp. NBC_01571]|nr:hypothetical protein [Streptomyces sp. NBC_01571]